MSNEMYFIGIDVGTGSCRAGLVDAKGCTVAVHVQQIKTFNAGDGQFEQSSDDIWENICICVREVLKHLPSNGSVNGIGVCATCSLAVFDSKGDPVSVSHSGNDDQNIILWMDHRAEQEANIINNTGHAILKYVGGGVSLEMEMPKMLWLKRNLPQQFLKMKHFFDLPDFITWKLTGQFTRSVCSTVCKWNYDAINSKWCTDFLEQIGLPEIIEDQFNRIGAEIQPPGEPVRNGLSEVAAKRLGLKPGIAVASSLIDAHSGALALLGCKVPGDNDVASKLAIIAGTSTCHMSITRKPVFPNGIWGPYYSAIFPKTYLNEAGQSTSGHLIDFIIESHPAYSALKNNFLTKVEIVKHLNLLLKQMSEELHLKSMHELTKDLHIWPDYHGNRSPLANPNLKGMICGLTLTADERNLARAYLATIQALAYGTKHIQDTLYTAGREKFKSVPLCGGLSKNEVFVQTHADVLEMPVGLPDGSEAMLLGAAILGARASGLYPTLEEAAHIMGGKATIIHPNSDSFTFHSKKYKVFLKMVKSQMEYDSIMNGC